MSLRALGSLLTRRFSPRGNLSAQGESSLGIGIQKAPRSAAGRPARHLHTLRDLATGDGVYGTAAMPALAGFVTFLYFNKDTEKTAGEHTSEDAEVVPDKEVAKEEFYSREEAIKKGFVRKDGKVNWPKYCDYVHSKKWGVPLYNKDVSVKEVTGRIEVKQEDVKIEVKKEDVKIDEPTMKARFHVWIKQHGRSYKTEEEKARRYEIFKKTAMDCDELNASRKLDPLAAPNGLADWTDEELKRLDFTDFDWEIYIAHLNKMASHGWCISNEDVTVSEAVKKKYKELAERSAEKRRQADDS